MSSAKPDHSSRSTSPLLALPVEIRLQIYSLLLLPSRPSDLRASREKVASSSQDYFDYDGILPDLCTSHRLLFRTIDPMKRLERVSTLQHGSRSTYSVRADRFRARCMQTTYHCLNVPHLNANLGLLRVNRQIHAECTEVLYGSYTWDFDTHIEALVPFLQDLTPQSRGCLKSLRIVKRALPYEKEFDKCEWTAALAYLASPSNGVALRRLELGVVAGRPGDNGWVGIEPHSIQDFRLLKQLDGMEWLQSVLEIRGLLEVQVDAVVEHCPPTTSSDAMARYVRFSASVTGGFADFLRDELLAS